MANSEGKETPIDPALIQKVTAMQQISHGIGGVLHGLGSFFSPGQPIQQSAGEQEKGRRFDYPVAYNTRIATKDDSTLNTTFAQLRTLADTYDVLRLVIETRKDTITRFPWSFVPVDEDDDSEELKALCADAQKHFEKPDGIHSFDTWLRMALEDLFVLDAPAWNVRRSKGGDIYGFEPVDGATIRVLLDYQGRAPIPPDPAYQQILHGLPATDLTSAELLYRPRNLRTNKVYGYGPVEQLLVLVNTALRREAHVLEFYTAGSVPDAIAQLPDDWTAKQIAEFQTYFDSLLMGQTAERRKMRFIPGLKALDFPKVDAALKDPIDEWLARKVCYCFGVSPTPFVSQVNRAVSETLERAGAAEGLEPLLYWVEQRINEMAQLWEFEGIKFKFKREKEIDILKKAQAEDIQIKNGKRSLDECRIADGLEPIGVGNAVHTPAGLIFIGKGAPAQTVQQPVTEPKPASVKEPPLIAAPDATTGTPAPEGDKPAIAKADKGGARAIPPVPFKGPRPSKV